METFTDSLAFFVTIK